MRIETLILGNKFRFIISSFVTFILVTFDFITKLILFSNILLSSFCFHCNPDCLVSSLAEVRKVSVDVQ